MTKAQRNCLPAILEAFADFLIRQVTDHMDRKTLYEEMRYGPAAEWSKSKCSKYIDSMARRGYLVHIANSDSFEFTTRAKLRVVEKFAQKSKIDGLIRIFSFDIPERMRWQRDQFRMILFRLGCVKIQKSLWVADRDITEIVESTLKELKIEKYVIYGLLQKTNIDSTISDLLQNIRNK